MPLLTLVTRHLLRRLRAGVQTSEKTADEQSKMTSFLNDEIKDCASHYYEEVRDREDVVAKLAASTEKMKQMELTMEVS